jgi:hypothetical protein
MIRLPLTGQHSLLFRLTLEHPNMLTHELLMHIHTWNHRDSSFQCNSPLLMLSHCVERIPALSFFPVSVPVGVLFLLELLLLAMLRDIAQREQSHIDRIV